MQNFRKKIYDNKIQKRIKEERGDSVLGFNLSVWGMYNGNQWAILKGNDKTMHSYYQQVFLGGCLQGMILKIFN